MSGLASGDLRKAVMWRRGTRALALCAVSAALSGCYYYVPPSTQLACVPAAAGPAQQQAPNGCPAGTAASYVQTPGYTAPYYGYAGYGYPYYGYPYYGYGYGYGWPGYYGPAVSVGWGWGWGGWGWHGGRGWGGGRR